jgi:hypothetical protein
MNDQSKVTADHLRRDAYLYVRQSSLYQVANNTESARRQYDLRGRAVALGWASDQVTVIDIDQGQSGASAADREGFQQLVAEVSLGRAGIVLGLECSRLARNSADWHQLLELCAMTGTLICDEDGLYDPRTFNDRLLLGMKGQMSEALCRFPDKASPGYPFNRRSPGHPFSRAFLLGAVPCSAAGRGPTAVQKAFVAGAGWRSGRGSAPGRGRRRARARGRTAARGCGNGGG